MNDHTTYLRYRIFQRIIGVQAPEEIASRLYPRLKPVEIAAKPDYTIEFTYLDLIPPPPESAHWSKIFSGEMSFQDRNVYYRRSKKLIRIEKTPGKVTVFLPRENQPYLPPESVMDTALMLLLEDQGYFPLHASGGKLKSNILFPGKSGSGKSTLSYRIAECGGNFLADDHIFLKLESGKEVAHSYLTTALLRKEKSDFNPDKKTVDLHRDSFAPVLETMIPDTLVFPQFFPGDEPLLQPLPIAQAAMKLIPLTLPPQKAAEFARLTALAEQCRCFVLYLPQSGENPELIKKLLIAI